MSRGYVTAKRLIELERSLSDRDRAVLDTLARVRVMTASQLERLHFADVTRRQSRRALTSLVGRRLVARLPRVVGGLRSGSAGYVYALDIAGLRLAQPGHGRPQRPWPVGVPFLRHSLAISELYVRLREEERSGDLRLVDFTTEPGCWRTFHGPGGARVVLKPDVAMTVQLGRFEDHWFVEVDLGTESRPTLARKCELYRRYWQAGTEQARTGVFPRVLWLVPDAPRHEAMTGVLGQQPAESWRIFAVALAGGAVERLMRGATT